MSFPPIVNEHGPATLATVLLIVVLGILDAHYTLELTSLGAKELNPIMAFYLKKSPLVFFVVKYLMTCSTLIILVSLEELSLFGLKVRRGIVLMLVLILMTCVVQWELHLLRLAAG